MIIDMIPITIPRIVRNERPLCVLNPFVAILNWENIFIYVPVGAPLVLLLVFFTYWSSYRSAYGDLFFKSVVGITSFADLPVAFNFSVDYFYYSLGVFGSISFMSYQNNRVAFFFVEFLKCFHYFLS